LQSIIKPFHCILLAALLTGATFCPAQKIDRKALVSLHNVMINRVDTLGSLTLGNGKFAFTVDATGLQSFPEYYAHGIPLGTESEWGWHSFPNKEDFRFSETLKAYHFNGANRLYSVQAHDKERNRRAAEYFRQNPHRLQLGNIGLEILKKDGTLAKISDLQDIHQELDLWQGLVTSNFKIEGIGIKVITCADAVKDAITVKITSSLLKQHRIKIRFRFAYPTNEFADMGVNYTHDSSHQTIMSLLSESSVIFTRKLDDFKYYVAANWSKGAEISKANAHDYLLVPAADTSFEASIEFSPKAMSHVPAFSQIKNSSAAGWKKFWLSGAAVDFSGSTDSRAAELERRVVLSQYLTRVQCVGNFPPQETGLTYNSWYGRPHMEMYWWHAAHYALWGRTDLLEKSMRWYFTAFNGAEAIAKRQGYKGVRWQKMTDNTGGDSPSDVGSFLIWQQPHVIYLAELIYRNKPSKTILQKYQKLVFATADFMASFAHYDKTANRYNLGNGLIPAQENYKPAETFNPPFELAYWKWALQTAQQWRKRLGMAPDKNWQAVINKLAPLPQKGGVYLLAESIPDGYAIGSSYLTDHPAVLAAYGMLPQNHTIDTAVMHRTYDLTWKRWDWKHTWGWDFPMAAMTATRLNQPEKAIDALFKDAAANTYLANGHNYQNKRLTLYLPGNGSLLSAIALMCAGYDGNKITNPGFPKNGKWKVRWEGLKPMP
jgi:hypothetical protein